MIPHWSRSTDTSPHLPPGFVARVGRLRQIKGFTQCGVLDVLASTSRTPRKGSP